MMLFDWTPERVSTLTRLWADGYSASQIAAEIRSGVSRNAVIGKIHRLKLPKRRTTVSKSRTYPTPKPRPIKKVRLVPRVKKMRTPDVISDIPIEPMPVNAKAWEPLPGSTPIPLEKLNEHTCKWPVTPEAPFLFCGAMPIDGKPYCAHHARRAAGPPQPKMKAPGKW